MREIKFRGYNPRNKKWYYGDLCHFLNNVYIACDLNDSCDIVSYTKMIKVTPESVGQFTGVKDINNIDIYEGDKVIWYDSDSNKRQDIVSWMNGGLCLCNSQYTAGSYNELNVVGNIYLNK